MNAIAVTMQSGLLYVLLAEYEYDAWGNHLTIKAYKDGKLVTTSIPENHIAKVNPFRWKWYYFDRETSLYYINGNYYDPLLRRMIAPKNYQEILTTPHESIYALPGNSPLAFPSAPYTYESSLTFGIQKRKKEWYDYLTNFISGFSLIFSGVLITAGSEGFGAALGIGMIVVGAGLLIMGIADIITYKTGVNPICLLFNISRSSFDKVAHILKVTGVVLQIAYLVYSIYNLFAPGPQCFAAGTIIHTSEGYKPIEDIEIGDFVLSYDEESGKVDYKEVAQLFKNESNLRTTLNIKSEDGTIDEIVSTSGHKYYLPDNERNRNADEILEHASYEGLGDKWVSACDLKKGDRVLLANADSLTGKPIYGIVVGVETEKCEKFTTFNFEVEDFHTYYVGKNGILVHNAKCGLIDDVVPDGYEPTFKNGEYQHNPKHGMTQHGRSSAKLSSQQYGKYALDNAIPSPHGGKALYAYNGKNLIQFYPSNGYYHGYYTNLARINGRSARNWLLHYFDL